MRRGPPAGGPERGNSPPADVALRGQTDRGAGRHVLLLRPPASPYPGPAAFAIRDDSWRTGNSPGGRAASNRVRPRVGPSRQEARLGCTALTLVAARAS